MSECPTCGESFKSEIGMKSHHKQAHDTSLVETAICDVCDKEFTIRNASNKNQFCSIECKGKAQSVREERSCSMCNRPFKVKPSSSVRYCCQECQLEDMLERPRPDDPESLVWLLYQYEGYSIEETFRRQRAVLGFENRLYIDDVRQMIRDMGLTRRYTSWSLQKADPDTVGGAKPEGSDEWKRHYSSA